jgi:integrase/recombinase XerD
MRNTAHPNRIGICPSSVVTQRATDKVIHMFYWKELTMTNIRWERYPLLAQREHSRTWLRIQGNLGLAFNTIEAYGRAVESYLRFCQQQEIEPETARKEHIALYVHDLTTRPNPRGANIRVLDSGMGLANATLQQYLTAVRLWYDYLIEEGIREINPVGRGRYTPGKGFSGARERGLIPRYKKLPWLPTDEQWSTILEVAKAEPIRNRLMLAIAYDAALRREELCALSTSDIDPAHRLIRVRAETTKNRMERMVPYSIATSALYMAYLQERRLLSRNRGPLFLSESDRNLATPITIWTWSKVMKRIAERAGVQQFTTHTPRHLCLTDLARCGWDIHEIALFAGHRSIQTSFLYIHLSGRDLGAKIERGMASIHEWRVNMMKEVLQ